MKKKLSILIAAVAALVVFALPAAPTMAACTASDGDSRAQEPVYDENGNQIGTQPSGDDYLLKQAPAGDPIDADDDGDVDATGTILYGDFNAEGDGGYIGSTGSTGYIELSGNAREGVQLDGKSSNGALDGRVTAKPSSPGVCINGQGT